MHLVDETKNLEAPCHSLAQAHIRALGSKLSLRILLLLGEHEDGMHASAIAKRLREHEQKIYYHSRRLLAAGVIAIDRTEDARGGTAKILRLRAPAAAIVFGQLQPFSHMRNTPREQRDYLAPFIENGQLTARIVIGSPDPHGPEQARSRDANYAVDFGLFLGTHLTSQPHATVMLDTELRDWNQHLIIIGGPVVNKAAQRLSKHSPVPYDQEAKAFKHGRRSFAQENVGVIVKMPNPFARGKWILHIAGKRHTGTRAAILAFLSQFDAICASPTEKSGARVVVVEGIDADSDGVVDSARII